MANLKAEFHEHLTRPRDVKYDEEMNICSLESRLEMRKSHANVVSFDEKVSYLLTSMNLYLRNSYWTDRTNIGTIIVKLQFYRGGQNTDHQSKDYPKGPP